jgi:hypothetical protein
VIPHSEKVPNIGSHGRFLELRWQHRPQPGSGQWQTLYKRPRYGLSLLLMDFGQPRLTGYALGVVPHFDFHLLNRSTTHLAARVGTGLGFFQRTFYTGRQWRNRAVGSHVEVCLQAFLDYYQRLGRKGWASRVELQLGFGLTHFSNGNIREPNWGINSASLSLGAQYDLQGPVPQLPPVQLAEVAQRWVLNVGGVGGTKQQGYINGTRHPVAGLEAEGGRRLGRRSALTLGTEGVYHPILASYVFPDSGVEGAQFRHKVQVGIRIGHELSIGNLGVVAQVGTYLYTPTYFDGRYYQRIGLRYYFWHRRIFVGVALKTHFAVADYIGFSAGVRVW